KGRILAHGDCLRSSPGLSARSAFGRSALVAASGALDWTADRNLRKTAASSVFRALGRNSAAGVCCRNCRRGCVGWTGRVRLVSGSVGMSSYKAFNPLDGMVGYRDPRYERYGWASARADDIVNYLPARMTYLLLSVAAFFIGCKGRAALWIGWRDAGKHPSPN